MTGFPIVPVALDPVLETSISGTSVETSFSGTSVKFTIVSVTFDPVLETSISGTSVETSFSGTSVKFPIVPVALDPVLETGISGTSVETSFSGTSVKFPIVPVTLDPVLETGISGTSVKFPIVPVTLDPVLETSFSGTSVKLGVDFTTVIVSGWNSFFIIVIKNLKGCAWTAIKKGLLKSSKIHICVDSVLNAYQDKVQEKSGISAELLRTDGSRLWIIGLLLLLVFAYILTIDSIDLPVRLIMLGVISSLYYLYDITIHEFSKNRTDLYGQPDPYGQRDYPKVLKFYLHGEEKRSSFKKS